MSTALSVEVSTEVSPTLNTATFVPPVLTGEVETKALPLPAKEIDWPSTGLP
jgi:hypothetical protein